MLQEIAKALDMEMNEENFLITQHLQRIQSKLPADATPDHPEWREFCQAAQEDVGLEGNRVMQTVTDRLVDANTPKERVYKIKRTAKGARIKIKSASGKSFSFGPVWCDSVKAGKGIALAPVNREKLEMHAQYLGLSNFAKLEAKALAAAIAEKL